MSKLNFDAHPIYIFDRNIILKKLYLSLLLFLMMYSGKAQYIFKEGNLPQQVSILNYAKIADVAHRELTIQEVRNQSAKLNYKKLNGFFGNLGFTDHNFWVYFEVINALDRPITYYIETAEPITNNVNLYLFDQRNSLEIQHSGDNLPFKDRAVQLRKTIFKLYLNPFEKKSAYLEIKNDGEKNTLPLELHSQENQLVNTYHEQLIMGLFYGILFAIGITYLFFFLALKEITFLYYSLYVIFVGLCHFSLDGLFHQYFLPQNNWFNLHAVIIFAIGGSYFFGKYSEIILDIKARNRIIHYTFKGLYFAMGLVLLGIVCLPSFLSYSYPIVNVLTLAGMMLIVIAIITFLIKGYSIDRYYTGGISILFLCFTVVIFINFGFTYNSLFLDNITKIGIALEVIALSLSMANRIRVLKSKKEELQAVALQRSREMNETKSYFLSNMSHELRTPLNAIIGLTNLMQNDITDPKLKANFELIQQASGNLISSVNDILDFSKIEKGELKLDTIRFLPLEILESVRMRFAKQAADKGLIFEFDSFFEQHIFLLGDPVRLDQMLNNILNNALKFTNIGVVSLHISAKILIDGYFELFIRIMDTGEGIPPEKLETVFNVFSQMEVNNKRRFGGFGIGLCVVKALVELHHGSISLKSTLHVGTTCTITLRYPVAPPEVKRINVFPEDGYDLLQHHILVVEDNPMNQIVLKMMFNKWKNATISYANDGMEGLEMMRLKEIDIVLMDLQMPVMDGYEAIEAIRSGRAGTSNQHVPIIAITADLMEHTKERVFQLGVNDYMTKPVDQKLLYEKITTCLS